MSYIDLNEHHVQSTILMTHTGGDGAHFILNLIHMFCNNFFYVPVPEGKVTYKNEYRYYSPFKSIDGIKDITDAMGDNLVNGMPWYDRMQVNEHYTPNIFFVQQTHSNPWDIIRSLKQHNCPLRLILIVGKDPEQISWWARLNNKKNGPFKDTYYELGDWYGQDSYGYTCEYIFNDETADVFILDYQKLIVQHDFDHWKHFIKWLNSDEVDDNMESLFVDEVTNYHNKNILLLENDNFDLGQFLSGFEVGYAHKKRKIETKFKE